MLILVSSFPLCPILYVGQSYMFLSQKPLYQPHCLPPSSSNKGWRLTFIHTRSLCLLTSPYQIPCFQFFSLLNLLVIPLFVILVTLTLTCSIISFLRWKESFAYLWGLLLGSRQCVHMLCVYVWCMSVLWGLLLGLRQKVYAYALYAYARMMYVYTFKDQKHWANVESHYSLLCLSVAALCPAHHLLSSQQTEIWCFSVLPWRVWLLLTTSMPHLAHPSASLNLPLKDLWFLKTPVCLVSGHLNLTSVIWILNLLTHFSLSFRS